MLPLGQHRAFLEAAGTWEQAMEQSVPFICTETNPLAAPLKPSPSRGFGSECGLAPGCRSSVVGPPKSL